MPGQVEKLILLHYVRDYVRGIAAVSRPCRCTKTTNLPATPRTLAARKCGRLQTICSHRYRIYTGPI
ncbi:hypothetical protein NEILACOT_04639 [Neisseria lactamica ATCC 23970]|uniref:Uncharacterized protein n=1 Tax=Neisseria lactamica ATCC 23970 TaxID=546265 RepID=D0WAR8_NEILA|nr:hypothetical protein NEILACOT_04639 [Neisseria lactamica ATCC 23970]